MNSPTPTAFPALEELSETIRQLKQECLREKSRADLLEKTVEILEMELAEAKKLNKDSRS